MMRTLWFLLVWGLLELKAVPAPAWEYLSAPELSSTPALLTHDPVRLSINPQGFHAGPPPFWVLGAELRDVQCPTCQFPEFFLPELFEGAPCTCGCFGYSKFCPPSPTVTARNTAVSVMLPSRTPSSLRFSQDTTQTPVSCSQELNTFLYQESVIPPDVQLATLQGLSGLRGLTARFVHQVESAQHLDTCPTPFALAATLVGIKLWNPLSQTLLNYQLTVFDS